MFCCSFSSYHNPKINATVFIKGNLEGGCYFCIILHSNVKTLHVSVSLPTRSCSVCAVLLSYQSSNLIDLPYVLDCTKSQKAKIAAKVEIGVKGEPQRNRAK